MAVPSFPETTIICDEAILDGKISFGDNNIIHPKCTIVSEGGGDIIFGDNNIIEENVYIVNKSAEPLYIGNENIFQVGSSFEGKKVGNGCAIEAKAHVAAGTILGNNCVVGANCSTRPNEIIANNVVIFGSNHARRTQTKSSRLQANLHARHLEYLQEVLPKYHHVKKQ